MNKLDKKNAQFIDVYDYMWGDELSNSGDGTGKPHKRETQIW